MRSKRRIFILAFVFALVLVFSACGSKSGGSGGAAPADSGGGGGGGGSGAELAFVIPANQELGINDKGWIQNIWESMDAWAKANGKTATYYQTVDDSKQSHIDTYDLAIQNGAKLVFGCGNECLEAMREAPWDYPDIMFISLEASDLMPNEIAPNLYALCTGQQEAGWLAGNAAVREGYRNVGIIPCFDIPPLNQWSWGWISGVNYAANKYNVSGITVRHHYANSASANPETQALAAAWYADGLDMIQCNTAGGNNSVIAAATAANKPVFGADTDQSKEGPTVVTSMLVDRTKVVTEALDFAYSGDFKGSGEVITLGVKAGVSKLAPWESSRFQVYTEDQYKQDLKDFGDDVDGARTGMVTPVEAVDIHTFIEMMGDKLVIEINHIN